MVSLGPPLAHGPRAETPSDGAQPALIAGRLCSAEAAVEAVKPGNRIFVGTACATPIGLVQALERRKPVPPDVELFYFLTSGLEPLWSDQPSAIDIAVSSSAPTCARWCIAGRLNMCRSRLHKFRI